MTTSEQRGDLDQLLTLLFEADVAIIRKPVVVLNSGQSKRRVTWPPSSLETGDLYRKRYASVDEYRDWVRAEAYSAVLFDGALLQLSFDFAGVDLTGHRLVYFPCPYLVEPALLREEALLDVMDLYANSRSERPRLVSPLRFEYDAARAKKGHPASHLTTISSDCRWAVTTPLSTGHFIRFVFSHFYPELYQSHGFVRSWPQRYASRTITDIEESLLHISSGRLVGG